MKIDRRDLKWRARDAMRAACPNALFMTFIYLLFTSGLGGVVGWFAADPLSDVLHLYRQGLALDRALPLALMAVGQMGLFWNILMAVCGVVIEFGYKIWCLNTARGRRGELGDLFGGFSMVGRILWLRVLILVYGFLWYVAIFVPMGFLTMLGAGMSIVLPIVGIPIFIGGFLLATALWLSRILRYAMAVYCLSDEPEKGASRALRRSVRMMEGRVTQYVLLMLSFLGWVVAIGFIVAAVEGVLFMAVSLLDQFPAGQGITSVLAAVLSVLASWPLYLWLMPYVTMTECNFYDRIRGDGENAAV